tara:strand:- start:274 stop:798 length:525 start_codon:yes stop_codon:yes gene_type:complete
MAKSTVVKTNVMGSLTATDATPTTPLTYACTFDMGDFSLSGLQEGLRELVIHERKGNYCGMSYGARVFPSFSFTAKIAQFTDSASGTLTDFVLRTAGSEYATAVSTSGTGRPYTTTWTFVIEGLDVGDDADHTVTLEDCHLTAEFAEGDADSISISGVVYGAITGDLAQSEKAN